MSKIVGIDLGTTNSVGLNPNQSCGNSSNASWPAVQTWLRSTQPSPRSGHPPEPGKTTSDTSSWMRSEQHLGTCRLA